MGLNYKYQDMFQVVNGKECLVEMDEAPKATRLFGDFIYEGDFAVMCGTEGTGKSLLGLQIADAISRGRPIDGFGMDCGAQPVMYLDFESKKNEFIRRYSMDGKNPHEFSDNFFRVTFHPKYFDYTGIRKQLLSELNHIFWRKPILVVVNNLEYLKCFAAESYVLAVLKEMQVNYNFTVLVLAGKRSGKTHPKAGINQLSRAIRGLADSIFALGHSKKGETVRYAKQLKNSTGAPVYHDKKVAEFTIGKKGNFTGLTFTGFGREYPHIAEPPAGIEAEIINLKLANPALTYLEIAEQLDTYKMKVKRALDKYEELLSFEYAHADSNCTESLGTVVTNRTSSLTPTHPDDGITENSTGARKDSETLAAVVTTVTLNSEQQDTGDFKTGILNSKAENSESLGAVVTNETTVTEVTLSSLPLLSHTDSPQEGMPTTKPESLAAVVTTVTQNPELPQALPKTSKPNQQLTYSQQLKKRLAEARRKK
ncbi:MAG TPA: AAA family ATPase [Bacteroidia bacterium]|nr:AAA family ATPase [Bacteroidia bacterium]